MINFEIFISKKKTERECNRTVSFFIVTKTRFRKNKKFIQILNLGIKVGFERNIMFLLFHIWRI